MRTRSFPSRVVAGAAALVLGCAGPAYSTLPVVDLSVPPASAALELPARGRVLVHACLIEAAALLPAEASAGTATAGDLAYLFSLERARVIAAPFTLADEHEPISLGDEPYWRCLGSSSRMAEPESWGQQLSLDIEPDRRGRARVTLFIREPDPHPATGVDMPHDYERTHAVFTIPWPPADLLLLRAPGVRYRQVDSAWPLTEPAIVREPATFFLLLEARPVAPEPELVQRLDPEPSGPPRSARYNGLHDGRAIEA